MPTQLTPVRALSDQTHVFDRVLVGIDGSEASAEAARQAAVLTEHYGDLTLLAVYPPMRFIGVDLGPELDLEETRRESEEAVSAAATAIATLAAPRTKLARGLPWQQLIEEAELERDALIVVGDHGQGRFEGIIAASTVTELLHKAPCSVLVTRPAPDRFPQRVVVGLDGSPESALAFAAARRVASRFGSVLWPVVALGGKRVDLQEVARLTDHRHEELPGEPVAALLAASADADLLVLGSRGLHGVKSLGSVSERVAHRAHCSTLVVRDPAEARAPRG
jgi:nucleotide-binding universal stress UspA family protein